MNTKTFFQNVEKWAHTNPKEAHMLPYHSVQKLSFKDTLQSSQKWFTSLELKNKEVLIVYGVGSGHAYTTAKKWLHFSSKRELIFLEDDLNAIHHLFNSSIAKEILSDSQVTLLYFDSLEDSHSPLSELYWNFLSTKITVSAFPYYEKKKREKYDQLKHKLFYDVALNAAMLEEYLDFGVSFFRNFYSNLLHLPESYLGHAIFNKFKNIPAIICGAGPSLSKHIPRLKQLQLHALLFPGGSALNALHTAKITPHFAAGIDPNSEQLKRLKETQGLNIPFFYRNRMYHPAFRQIQGAKLYIPGSGGYDIAEWFEKKLNIPPLEEELDEGYNVINFCLSIAERMGCNPIIFIGMDLAYTGMKAYAQGIVRNEKITKKKLTEGPIESTAVVQKDIYGKQIYTLWKWITESNWISDFAKDHPKIKMYNATEGGIGFKNVPNIGLEEATHKLLIKKFNLQQRINKALKASRSKISSEQVKSAMKDLKDSLVRAHQHLSILIEEYEKIVAQTKKERKLPAIQQSGLAALAETELAEEDAFKAILEIFNAVYSRLLNREWQKINAAKLSSWKQWIKRMELNIKRFTFLRNVASANITLIAHAGSDSLFISE